MSEELDLLTELLLEKIEEIFDYFKIELTQFGNRYTGTCPVHGGDNDSAFSLFTSGNTSSGNWKCFTNNCQATYGSNIFGFIRGILSRQRNKEINFHDAVAWAKDFTKLSSLDRKEDLDYSVKKTFRNQCQVLTKERQLAKKNIDREMVTNSLHIPARYYLERGYKQETLEKYDVGLCNTQGKEMFGRVVIPFYDDEYKYIVGCIGRTTQPHCEECGQYHYRDRHCPSNSIEKLWAVKWRNSKGFNAESYLFNYWFAKKQIQKCGIAVLVEGQGDVLRLEESGIHIGLALSKCALSEEQALILEKSGVMNIVLCLDNDSAGQQGREKIEKDLSRMYNVLSVSPPNTKDIGEMSPDEVRQFLIPILKGI